MEKEYTLKILNALANGIHPATGEQFGADSPYQHPDTVRALFEAMRAVESAAASAPAPAAERLRFVEPGGGARARPQPQPRRDRGAAGAAGQDGCIGGYDALALPAQA